MNLLPLLTALAIGADYPRPELLVEASQLLKEKDVVILDVRGSDVYASGHIPNAIAIDTTAWGKAFPNEPDAADWSKRLGAIGIDAKTRVVVHGDADVRDPARIWWMLRYWGVNDVRLLNGGWDAWKAAGGSVSTDVPSPKLKTVTLSRQSERLATKVDLLKELKGTPPQIIDARSAREHCGELKSAKRGGAIPGAIHLEWKEAIDPKSGRFKSPDELTALLKANGIDPSQPTVTYCQSGGRAAVMAFTIELMGGKQVRNYYQSWSEWGNDEQTPIVVPKLKK